MSLADKLGDGACAWVYFLPSRVADMSVRNALVAARVTVGRVTYDAALERWIGELAGRVIQARRASGEPKDRHREK